MIYTLFNVNLEILQLMSRVFLLFYHEYCLNFDFKLSSQTFNAVITWIEVLKTEEFK